MESSAPAGISVAAVGGRKPFLEAGDVTTIALIAHDAKKADIVAFAHKHRDMLSKFKLVATGTTGGRINEATGLEVERMLSGPIGGDQQIGAMVATGAVHLVVFLIDPLTAAPHDPDIQGLVRVCNVVG